MAAKKRAATPPGDTISPHEGVRFTATKGRGFCLFSGLTEKTYRITNSSTQDGNNVVVASDDKRIVQVRPGTSVDFEAKEVRAFVAADAKSDAIECSYIRLG